MPKRTNFGRLVKYISLVLLSSLVVEASDQSFIRQKII